MLGKFVWLFKSVAFWFSSKWLLQKINKKIKNTFSIKLFGSRSGPMCLALFARNVKPDLDPKLFWLTLADEELTGFFIFAAFYLL